MDEEKLRQVVAEIVTCFKEIERENFSKGEFNSLQDRWQVVLINYGYDNIKENIREQLHSGPAFVAAINTFTYAIENNQARGYIMASKMIKAFGAQTGLEGRVD